MPICIICSTETLLMVNGIPLCVECGRASPVERERRMQITEKAQPRYLVQENRDIGGEK
jgi:hypothetical protein